MNKKIVFIPVLATFMVLSASSQALAHVVVKPGQVGLGERLNFTVSVPTEEADPTVQVRLVIPEGLQSVRPNVKPGWNIQLVKVGEGEAAKISEIVWSGGRIPADQRDEFVFSAQAPAIDTTLIWKAYQTYSDGDVVAWENDPKVVEEYAKSKQATASGTPSGEEDDHNAPRPYSTTKVVNDLSKASAASQTSDGTGVAVEASNIKDSTDWVAYAALLVGAIALALNLRGMMKPKQSQL